MSAPYEYSYVKERGPGTSSAGERTERKPRYRGRCSCGRQTHLTYSTPGIALTAIRFVHNPDIPEERHAA